MDVIYARQLLPQSIFLAGPTPRDPSVPSWRPEAIEILKQLGFNGTVFVPEDKDWGPKPNYDAQVEWEWCAIDVSTIVVFWVPRELETMPAFTTNVEFGLEARNGKAVFGCPPGSPKNHYLEKLAERFHIPVYHDLTDTLRAAVNRCDQLTARTTGNTLKE